MQEKKQWGIKRSPRSAPPQSKIVNIFLYRLSEYVKCRFEKTDMYRTVYLNGLAFSDPIYSPN